MLNSLKLFLPKVKNKILFALITLLGTYINAQNFTLSGKVKDSTNAEVIAGTSIACPALNKTSVTDNYGNFSISLPAGTYEIVVFHPDFVEVRMKITFNRDVDTLVSLLPLRYAQISTVKIVAQKQDNVKKIDMSTQTVSGSFIKKIPAFLGEADVIKAVQLLPGVTTVGEGATGFNVRGGSIDQNLVLIDEAPVFNSAHLFGFFSIFNPDAVKDVQLVKGGIPANYGGRLSGVLDVRQKDGNKKQFEVNGGIGTIFSRLSVEGPIIKNKMSFIVAARRSYIDVLAKPFLKGDLKKSQFSFYDYTAKVNYSYKRNSLYLSGYFGDDKFAAVNAFGVKWGNSTVTARWNRTFDRRLFGNFTYYYSRYRYNIIFQNRDIEFNWKSYIINNSLKADFSYHPTSKNQLSFGGQSIYYRFVPGDAKVTGEAVNNNFSLPDKYALDNSLYVSNDYNASGRFSLRYGLRYNQFLYMGKGKAYYYKEAVKPGARKEIDYTKDYGSNEIIKAYNNWEPRLGAKYQLNKESSLKLGYNRMVQNLHLISNTAASVPFDVWQPSTNNILPEKSDQIALGYFLNKEDKKKNLYEFSIESYYKQMQNQVDYVDGASLLLNEFLEGDLLNGKGRAYGLELYVKKASGPLTGWISYTLSRSERKVAGINSGEWYPNRFDRTHNVYIVAQYNYNNKWDFGANFVFSTGTPTTFYSSQYLIQGYIVPDPGGSVRNNVRNPVYHRLDLSATLHNKKKNKRWESDWVFSVYNAYNRRNPFSIYFATNYKNQLQNEAIKYSVIGSFIPAISYNFKWK